MKKLGGFSSPFSKPASNKPSEVIKPPELPKPAPTKPAETPALTKPAPSKPDSFSTPTPTGGVQQPPPKKPGGSDVTSSFTQDPTGFGGKPGNVLNITNTQRPPGTPGATPQQPFVNASDSTVTMNVFQRPGGNANLHLSPPGGQGAQVHYLDYLPEGSGRFAGLQGVPQHPGPNDPKMLVTGQLNGCAVHALHDSRDQSLSFLHHANYSKNGQQELKDFLTQHPHLSPAATLGPQDYSHPIKPGSDQMTGATAFAQYRPSPTGQGLGQWHLMGQLNDMAGMNMQDMRPSLQRPNFPGSPMLNIPIEPPK